MYAVFLWASIGTLLATLNWVIAWCVFGLVLVTLRRIDTEERILVDAFGGQYLEYRRRVSALGPPWGGIYEML
jgi:protein-S-isoprenylcysteine O-methyltransferase Ste14